MTKAPAATARVLAGIGEIAADRWDALANPDGQPFNPFVSHAFLRALEDSGSATRKTGWTPRHIVVEGDDGAAVGALPCYAKTHSRGEYVFDWSWADAFERAGGHYYPKLQASVPFTPATGPRFLTKPGADRDRNRALLAQASIALAEQTGASSVHVTFLTDEEAGLLADGRTWLKRTDTQFHWHNADYATFDDFLADLASRKRKNIRKEREAVARAGITLECVTGKDLAEKHWDAFFQFYMDTGARKWGSPYLTRAFFSQVGETMADHTLLVMARRNGRYIAGALNFIGSDALYGRNWGAIEHHDCLHFETCYYQAIEFAIARKLARVEAGAQGPHKLARGYLPVETQSLHHIVHPGLSRAVAEYLAAERRAIAEDNAALTEHSPFRRDPAREEADF
ncbi:MAG: GNAT family N-acetyltransferase [Hyphomicrobiales bacterium]